MLSCFLAALVLCPGSPGGQVQSKTAGVIPLGPQTGVIPASPQAPATGPSQRLRTYTGRVQGRTSEQSVFSLAETQREVEKALGQARLMTPMHSELLRMIPRYGFVFANDIRLDLNFDKTPLCDALKQVAERSKHELRLEKDVPANIPVTLSASNIRLSTALDFITQSADVKWGRDVKLLKESKQPKSTIVVGKRVSPGTTVTMWEGEGDAKPEWTINTAGMSEAILLDMSALAPRWTFTMTEVQSSFTCPHCHGQVTTLRQRGQPNCPKCGRVFQNEWQFCPADGARRPYTNRTWHFCPICGKAIEFGEVSEAPSGTEQLLSPGSRFAIKVEGEDCKKDRLKALNGVFVVAGDGTIRISQIGRVNVNGLTAIEASKSISNLLKPYVKTAVVKGEVVPRKMDDSDMPDN